MSKKMKFPSIFRSNRGAKHHHHHAWQWHSSCNNPKTLSFRANEGEKLVLDRAFVEASDAQETSESWFTRSSSSSNLSRYGIFRGSKNNEEEDYDSLPMETIIREGRSSERLFFEPGETRRSSSILKKETEVPGSYSSSSELGFIKEGSVALMLESADPYLDFKISMQEMVESHGLGGDWERLQQLLGWYLHMNRKTNHGFIFSAFMDLLLGLVAATDSQISVRSSDLTSYSSAASSFSSHLSPPSQQGCRLVHEQ